MSSREKISILVNDLDSGGAERVISILLDMLSSRYDITLYMMHDIIFYDIPKDIKVVIINGSKLKDGGLVKLLKLPLMGWRYKNLNRDAMVSLSFLSRSNYINVFAKMFGMEGKVIVSERAMPSLQYKDSLEGSINRLLIKLLYKRADRVFANSKGNALDLEKNFNIESVDVINNIFNIKRIINLSKRYVLLNDDKDRFNFITIGRLDEGKNHQLLIRAMLEVDANLYIIGDGILKNELQALIEELGLEDRVFLLGKQKNPYKYISRADAFLFSSKREGFPNVLVEALACSLPIVSTDCPSGPREILAPDSDVEFKLKDEVESAEYGLLVPVDSKDKMVEAMNIIKYDKELRESYREKALNRAMEFNKEEIIDEFIKIID